MRSIVCLGLVAGILAGCVLPKSAQQQDSAGEKPQKSVVTQQAVLVGKVVSVKTNLDFAVLNFPIGNIPARDQHLNIYREGVKVGEVKVTGPQQNEDIVCDIISGMAQPGDEIRGN